MYDVNREELFGVQAVEARLLQFNDNGYKTTPELHKCVWQDQEDFRFSGDYTQVPRGRIFEVKNKGFEVNVGDWINEYPEVKEKILKRFKLPIDTEFVIDSHWDLGHGWSDELM